MHKPIAVLLTAVTVAAFGLQGQQPNTHTDTQGVKLIANVSQRKTLNQVPEKSTTAITADYTAPAASAPVQRVEPVSQPVVVSDNDAMAFIFMHESSNRPDAVNEIGACGLGQSLPCSKLSSVCPNWRTDVACQRSFFTNYANQRYGGWEQARIAWQSKGWW